MSTEHYIIRGGADGRERLRMLARVMQPTTLELFRQVGIRPGMACLDVGCGGGDVTADLARLVGQEGLVVGTDLDETKLALARDEAAANGLVNVEYRRADIVDDTESAAHDLVYARFLLTHLPDPAGALAKLHGALRPGGVIVVEDIDYRGCFCEPDCQAFRRSVELYTEAAMRRGADPYIGPRLPQLLVDAGFEQIQMHVIQPAGMAGEVKRLIPITMASIGPAVLAEGLASEAELNEVIAELEALADDRYTVMSIPRVVQAWGRRPAA
jgi:ubiquinone/menaquinone biosynthesis C-methylase UbiE